VRSRAVETLGALGGLVQDPAMLTLILKDLRGAIDPTTETDYNVRRAAREALIRLSCRWRVSTPGPWAHKWSDLARGQPLASVHP